MAGVTFMFVI